MPNVSPSALVPKMIDRRVTVFVGAGISVLPPSCLPSWWAINHAVLDVIGREAAEIVAEAASYVGMVKLRQETGKLPPEFTSEIIVETLGDRYFEVLGSLEGTRPNHVHRWLAAMAKAGRIPAIITTNFDTLIERACIEAGVPLNVLVDPADYEAVALDAQIADATAPTLLIKLHGTATRPKTCIDTLAQRKKGFPPEVARVVGGLVKRTALCIMGYSGADLDADPNYLFLRQHAGDGPGFEWLYLPSSEPPMAVRDLVTKYGAERARIVTGVLPDWLDGWTPALANTGISPPVKPGFTPVQLDSFKREATTAVSTHTAKWADELGPIRAGLILAGLLSRTGHDAPAMAVKQAVRVYAAQREPNSRLLAVCTQTLARAKLIAGEPDAANNLYREAIEGYIALNDWYGFSGAINDYSTLLVDLGQFDLAEKYLNEAIRFAHEFDEPTSIVWAKLDLAEIAQARGETDRAIGVATEAMQLAQQIGRDEERARAAERVALVLRDSGEPAKALELLREAALVPERLGLDRHLAYNLVQQAAVFSDWGKIAAAMERLDHAETLAERVGVKKLRASILLTRAKILQSTGDYARAEAAIREAVELRKQMVDTKEQLKAEGNLLGLLAVRGDLKAALDLGHDALARANHLGLPEPIALISANYALALEMNGNLAEARQFYEAALTANRARKDKQSEANNLGSLGNIALREADIERAQTAYQAALAIAESIGDIESRIRTLSNLAMIRGMTGDHAGAIERYRDAWNLAESEGIGATQGWIAYNLGNTLWQIEDMPGAAEQFGKACERFGAQGDNARAGEAAFFRAQACVKLDDLDGAISATQAAINNWQQIGHESLPAAENMLAQLESFRQ